jgi:hypothetical protein
MPRFKLAHIQQQGVDLIIIPLDPAFGGMTESEQLEELAGFQLRAKDAGLSGTVVPIWKEYGRMVFIAPSDWHPLFASLTPEFVEANLNRELYW